MRSRRLFEMDGDEDRWIGDRMKTTVEAKAKRLKLVETSLALEQKNAAQRVAEDKQCKSWEKKQFQLQQRRLEQDKKRLQLDNKWLDLKAEERGVQIFKRNRVLDVFGELAQKII